jgi:kynurenine formamidase
MPPTDHRVEFDFDLDFTNGGGLHAEGFRLDIPGEDISEADLIDLLVADLNLLMVGAVRIRNRRILTESHRRTDRRAGDRPRWVELSHPLQDGMLTYPGFPPLRITDYLSRVASRERYAPGTEFHIAQIEMVANTGTYLDSPFHRYPAGEDLADIGLDRLVDLPGTKIDADPSPGQAVEVEALRGYELRGRAVLVRTGWSKHWGTERYFQGHPFLTEGAAGYLQDCGAVLVGIDSLNIDSTSGGSRPVHTLLLGAGIPIVEHLCNLEALPVEGFTFSAPPPRIKGVGSFPVRACARLP